MRFLTAGSRGLLVELGREAAAGEEQRAEPDPAELYRALIRTQPSGAVEFVPAARTVLVVFDPALTSPAALAAEIETAARAARGTAAAPGEEAACDAARQIAVCYDGPDLDEVARMTGLSAAEVVERHSSRLYTVAFCGFAPGFGYLTGLDPTLRLPRRAVPRTRVPTGSVAISAEYTGVYPRSSPGGWHLLGRTDAAVWDPGRQPPALLVPGARVRFVPVRDGAACAASGRRAG